MEAGFDRQTVYDVYSVVDEENAVYQDFIQTAVTVYSTKEQLTVN